MASDPIQGDVVDASTAIMAQASAEYDVQIATAKRYPRSVTEFKADLLSMATLDRDTAESMFYALPRAGKIIEGPSVRLAEIVTACYGNLRSGARIVSIDQNFVTAEGMAMDMEKNVSVQVQVQRRITNKQGVRYKDDMIQTTCNAACSIALRQAVFKVVPMALVKPAYLAARKVAIGDASTLADRRAKMFTHFSKMGVAEEKVCARVGRAGPEDIALADLGVLIGLANAIRDGDTTVDQAFPEPPKPGSKSKTLDDLTDELTAPAKETPKPSEEPAIESGVTPFQEALLKQLKECDTIDAVKAVAKQYVAGVLSDADRQYLKLNIEARKQAIRDGRGEGSNESVPRDELFDRQ